MTDIKHITAPTQWAVCRLYLPLRQAFRGDIAAQNLGCLGSACRDNCRDITPHNVFGQQPGCRANGADAGGGMLAALGGVFGGIDENSVPIRGSAARLTQIAVSRPTPHHDQDADLHLDPFANLKAGQRADYMSKNAAVDLSSAVMSAGKAADLLNVNRASVVNAKKVLTEGTAEEIKAVEQGNAAVTTIARQIRMGASST